MPSPSAETRAKRNNVTVLGDKGRLVIWSKAHGHHVVFFDAKDEMWVRDALWHVLKHGTSGGVPRFYVACGSRSTGTHRLMHRIVARAPDDTEVDHINGDTLDNRRANLRCVSRQDNQWNRVKAKGYSWHTSSQAWLARIRVDGKLLHLGAFSTEKEALAAYLAAKERYHRVKEIKNRRSTYVF